jgi:hypothetical protein
MVRSYYVASCGCFGLLNCNSPLSLLPTESAIAIYVTLRIEESPPFIVE